MKTALAVLATLAAGNVTAAAAPAYTPPELFATPPELPDGYDAATALRLDLPGALQIAMAHNIGLDIERKQVAASSLTADTAAAVMYEPQLSAGYTRGEQIIPPQTLQAGLPSNLVTDAWTTGITQALPTGGSVGVGFTLSRWSSSSGPAVLPPAWGTGVTLGFTQPLLRGFSTDLVIPKYSILTAKLSSESERLNLRQTATNTVQQTENAYWDVVYAMYAYRVAVDSKRDADETFELTRRQIAAGMLPSSELSGAEATTASRQVAVLHAATAVEQSWDALRVVLALPRDQWSRPILPLEVPRFDATTVPSVDEALASATLHRPDFAQLRLDRESVALAIRKAENDRLPQINLSVGVTFNAEATASTALSELTSAYAPTWTAGISLSWTPLQRASKTAIELARIQREVKLETQEQHVEQSFSDVRGAVRGRNSAALEVATTARARELATAALATENSKYVAGTSSTTVVAQKQQELAADELAELQALISNSRAETALLVATGQLLEARHVELKVTR